MDRRVDVRHFVHRRSCDISSSNMAAYERWPRVSARGTKYSSEVCRMIFDMTFNIPRHLPYSGGDLLAAVAFGHSSRSLQCHSSIVIRARGIIRPKL